MVIVGHRVRVMVIVGDRVRFTIRNRVLVRATVSVRAGVFVNEGHWLLWITCSTRIHTPILFILWESNL